MRPSPAARPPRSALVLGPATALGAALALGVALALGGVTADGGANGAAAANPGPPVAGAFDLRAAVAAAAPGAIIAVPSGTHAGPLVIDKPLTLTGRDWPIVDGGGSGHVITITAPDVTVRGLVVRSSGNRLDHEDAGVTVRAPRAVVDGNRLEDVLFGVGLLQAPDGVVSGNTISGKDLPVPRRGDGIRLWYSARSRVEGNDVRGTRDVVVWFSPDTVVLGNVVRDGRYGVHTMFADHQRVEGNVLASNSVGAFLMYGRELHLARNLLLDNRGPSGYGVGLKDVDDVVAEGNRFVGNRVGAFIDGSPREPSATVRFVGNAFAYNEIGLTLLPSVRRNAFSGNAFVDNGEQVAISGRGVLRDVAWSTAGRGNFWSDYAGFDAAGDGIGDVPYVSASLYEDLMVTHPGLRLFSRSPAADALDLAARAFPVFQPRPKLVDEHPLTSPPALAPAPGVAPPARGANLAWAAAMLAVAASILAAGLHTSRLRPSPRGAA